MRHYLMLCDPPFLLMICFITIQSCVATLTSANCHTLPNKPRTDTPYELNNWAAHSYVQFINVSATEPDEVSYTYGCEFGYHFTEMAEGCVQSSMYEYKAGMIPSRAVHCVNGVWDLDGEPLLTFPYCRSVFLTEGPLLVYRNAARDAKNKIKLSVLPGFLDHRNVSISPGEPLVIPLVHKGAIPYGLKRWNKQTVEDYYLDTRLVGYVNKVRINDPEAVFRMKIQKIGMEVLLEEEDDEIDLDSDIRPRLFFTYTLPWTKIDSETFTLNLTTGPLRESDGGRWYYQDEILIQLGVAAYRVEYFDIHVTVPVNGSWAQWEEWGQCIAECGDGIRKRNRTCTDPAPAYGGNDCEGQMTDEETCSVSHPCPIDGSWGAWQEWGSCSTPCGGLGTRSHIRTCTEPQYGGQDCEGDLTSENGECGTHSCDADGNWAAWSEWTDCSATCGVVTKSRTRSCTDPPPRGNGAECPGSTVRANFLDEGECTLPECPSTDDIALSVDVDIYFCCTNTPTEN